MPQSSLEDALELIFGKEHEEWSDIELRFKLIFEVMKLKTMVEKLEADNMALAGGGHTLNRGRTIWGQPLQAPHIWVGSPPDSVVDKDITGLKYPTLLERGNISQDDYIEKLAHILKDQHVETIIIGGRGLGKTCMTRKLSELILKAPELEEISFEPLQINTNLKLDANPARSGMNSRKQKNRPDPRNNRKK